MKTCPLVLTGLAVAIAFRSGTWNIGAEGQLLVGALAATALARATGAAPWPLPLVAALAGGAIAGALWAVVAAALRVARNVNEVISTLMLNFVALRLVGWAVHGPLMEAGGRYPQSEAIPATAVLPRLAGRVHWGVVLAALAALAAWALLFRTARGFRWRAIGDNPRAAAVAGFRPHRELIAVMAVSGACAGVAGAVELLGVTGRLYEQFSAGQGYTAIAVALLGAAASPRRRFRDGVLRCARRRVRGRCSAPRASPRCSTGVAPGASRSWRCSRLEAPRLVSPAAAATAPPQGRVP